MLFSGFINNQPKIATEVRLSAIAASQVCSSFGFICSCVKFET